MPEGEEQELVDWTLNGEPVQSPPGLTILEACQREGVELPHFCYHPGLSIAGNCRICLVETNRSPKPAISCSERISPGLEVQTHSEMAVEAREGVMEFQLINHPLDCPVCDKAGECVLQDYSYEHGPDRSRFVESKNIRHTKDLGPTIEIWGNRCIVCTRCVRFCDEISGTGELCVTGRGDRSIIDVFPGVPLDNPLAGNVVDICPVGALISKDFLFQSRVWNVDRTDSVCAGCARGCNVEVEANAGYVKRLMPRANLEVNDYWICDYGRYDYRYTHSDDRLTAARFEGDSVPDRKAITAAAELLKQAQQSAIVVDPFLTVEEAWLVKRLAEANGCLVAGWLPPRGEEMNFPSGFKISSEKAPNRLGIEAVLGEGVFSTAAQELKSKLDSDGIDTLLLFAGFPHGQIDSELTGVVDRAKNRIVFALFEGPWSEGADVVIPAAAPFEKEGVYVNEDGRAQRVRSKDRDLSSAQPGLDTAAIENPRMTPESVRIQELAAALGQSDRRLSASAIFRQLSEAIETFGGLSHRSIGSQGQTVSLKVGGAV